MPLSQTNYQSWITPEDLLEISQTLREPSQEELLARSLWPANTEFSPSASEIGYDVLISEGSTKVVAVGAEADDIPMVGESKYRETRGAVSILNGYRWSRIEEMRADEARRIGRGAVLNFLIKRAERARRFLNETFDRIFMTGISEAGIKGVFDSSFYAASRAAALQVANKDKGVKENIAASGTGSTDAEKRLWANKTPGQIFEDLRVAAAHVNRKGIFNGDSLALTPELYWELAKPYSDQSPDSLLSVINQVLGPQGVFKRLLKTRALARGAALEGFNGDTVDYFMIFDSRSEVAEHCILQEIFEHPIDRDMIQNAKVAVEMRVAGLIMYQPVGIYIGKGAAKDP
jgi:hypothetical protein